MKVTSKLTADALSALISVILKSFSNCRGRHATMETNSWIDKLYFVLGYRLSESGYHLCVHNVTRNVTFLVMHTVPYVVTKPCGGWLPWKTCTVTLYRMTHQTEHKTVMEQVTGCCSGYEQVGHYCARRECTAHPLYLLKYSTNCSAPSYECL